MLKNRVIAFYLPQFYPTTENDKWWGKGFTEWTCMGKAKPLFKGHYQPRIPADLGYYDLRVPETREMQAEYARRAGIEGFCYWHYWFGNGKRLLERPFNEVLESGKPDYPFCLGWANHSWYKKLWDKDTKKDTLLIKQEYFGETDYKMHFEFALKAFKDHRYIMDGDKPLFFIFRPLDIPNDFIPLWQKWAKGNGFKDGISFVGQCRFNEDPKRIISKGFDYVLHDRTGVYYIQDFTMPQRVFQHLKHIILHRPLLCFDYDKFVYKLTDVNVDKNIQDIPMLIPNWDHSPRSGRKGLILNNSTPEKFHKHIRQVFNSIKNKPKKKRFVFLKSWNEWGEGNYVEPDQRFGNSYIDVLAEENKG